jgi:hypothetical protein
LSLLNTFPFLDLTEKFPLEFGEMVEIPNVEDLPGEYENLTFSFSARFCVRLKKGRCLLGQPANEDKAQSA